jgi:hypothetical protein
MQYGLLLDTWATEFDLILFQALLDIVVDSQQSLHL